MPGFMDGKNEMDNFNVNSLNVARALCLFVRREGGLRHDRIDTKELYTRMERGAARLRVQAVPAAGISRAVACRLYARAGSAGSAGARLESGTLGKVK